MKIQDYDFPEDRLYDVANQIWYAPLGDDTLRVGFTPIAMALAGDVLVFTPKRIGKDFEPNKWFATIECGKWVGSARAAFEGVVVAHNETLIEKPELLNSDAFGEGWMLVVRPARGGWRAGLAEGDGIKPAFDAWLEAEAYKGRTE